MNAALVEFSGIVTAVVAATAGLLLDKATLIPPLGAAVLLVTVQLSVPGPVKDVVLQESVRAELCAPWAAFLPVPRSFTVVVEVVDDFSATRLATELLDAELVAGPLMIVTSPVVAPESFGWKCTLKSRELPAARVIGMFPIPSIENESEETLIWEITTGAVPGLVRETLLLPDWPTVTVPKSTLEGDGTIDPESAAVPFNTNDAPQPDRTRQQNAIKSIPMHPVIGPGKEP